MGEWMSETSEYLVRLRPYHRDSGETAEWPDRRPRVRDVRLEDLPLR